MNAPTGRVTRLADRVYLLYGNKILGAGTEALRFSRGLQIDRCMILKDRKILLFGDTFGITGIPENLK